MTASIDLVVTELTATVFAKYGQVIEFSESNPVMCINEGRTVRHDALADIDLGEEEGKGTISLFKTELTQLPVRLVMMERHPLGSQAFVPLQPATYLVVVAPPGDFDIHQMRAFIARGSQGVNYHRGTWHHPHLVLEGSGEFLVVDRKGPQQNCDEVYFDNSSYIVVGT